MKKQRLKTITKPVASTKSNYIDPLPYEIGLLIGIILAICIVYISANMWVGALAILEWPAVFLIMALSKPAVRRSLFILYVPTLLVIGIISLCIKHRIIGFHSINWIKVAYMPGFTILIMYVGSLKDLRSDMRFFATKIGAAVLSIICVSWLLTAGSLCDDNLFKHHWEITYRDREGKTRVMHNRSAYDPRDLPLISSGYLINEESGNIDGDGSIVEILDAKTID